MVGIGFQAEQQANIDGIAKAGMAIRIPIFAANEKRLLKAVRKVQKPSFKENALRMQKLVRATDGVAKSVELMNRWLGVSYRDLTGFENLRVIHKSSMMKNNHRFLASLRNDRRHLGQNAP